MEAWKCSLKSFWDKLKAKIHMIKLGVYFIIYYFQYSDNSFSLLWAFENGWKFIQAKWDAKYDLNILSNFYNMLCI